MASNLDSGNGAGEGTNEGSAETETFTSLEKVCSEQIFSSATHDYCHYFLLR